MRMEDLDHPKDKPGADVQVISDLRWLGFDWDAEYVQSRRKPLYPGTCRGRFSSWDDARAFSGRDPCWRFRVEPGSLVSFDDVFAGRFECDVGATLGDFPLARDEHGAGYTLAVVVDDADMGVTEVVRGDDLLSATPVYCHVPLVVGPDGRRLAKRHGDTRVASYRLAGVRPEQIIGYLAASCGWAESGEELSLSDLLPRFSLESLPHSRFTVSSSSACPEWLALS